MSKPEMMPRHEHLLVVEDDDFSQELIALYLRKAGFTELTVATDGRQALELAKSRSFDLVLLDLNLPRISGTEVLRRLRAQHTRTLVLILSAEDEIDARIRGLDLGAEAHFNRPRIVFSRACSEPNPEYPNWNEGRLFEVAWRLLANGSIQSEPVI